MTALLNRMRGKLVVLKTSSSEEIGGRIVKVVGKVVILRTLLGTRIFVPIRRIVAVITR